MDRAWGRGLSALMLAVSAMMAQPALGSDGEFGDTSAASAEIRVVINRALLPELRGRSNEHLCVRSNDTQVSYQVLVPASGAQPRRVAATLVADSTRSPGCRPLDFSALLPLDIASTVLFVPAT